MSIQIRKVSEVYPVNVEEKHNVIAQFGAYTAIQTEDSHIHLIGSKSTNITKEKIDSITLDIFDYSRIAGVKYKTGTPEYRIEEIFNIEKGKKYFILQYLDFYYIFDNNIDASEMSNFILAVKTNFEATGA